MDAKLQPAEVTEKGAKIKTFCANLQEELRVQEVETRYLLKNDVTIKEANGTTHTHILANKNLTLVADALQDIQKFLAELI
jgi:hypothetical protein